MSEEKKISRADLYREIANAIDRSPYGKIVEPFPRRFFVDEPSPGVRLYLRETDEPDVVEYVHENCLAGEILNWINKDLVVMKPQYAIDGKAALEAARTWRMTAKPPGKIKNVSWPHDDGLTFRKLPWLKYCKEPTPAFNEMFSRITNGRALKCFIGSLFHEQSNMQQYCWIHGQGQNGKGALSRFLHRVMGNAYSSQIPPVSGDKFWTSMIMGKRLVVFPDCNNQGFVTSGLFKSLTGGDPVRIEQKGQPAATTIMSAKYIFLSNERPALSSEKADQRRIIYCEMSEVKADHDPKYEEKLWAEGGSFIAQCMSIYSGECHDHGVIPTTNEDILEDWVSTVEEEFETVWDNNFVVVDKETYVTPAAFQDRLTEIWKSDRRSQLAFRSWCERKHGLKKRTANSIEGYPKVYFGIALVFEGQNIRTGQCKQKEQQEAWKNKGHYKDISRTAKGRLKIVEPEE